MARSTSSVTATITLRSSSVSFTPFTLSRSRRPTASPSSKSGTQISEVTPSMGSRESGFCSRLPRARDARSGRLARGRPFDKELRPSAS